MDKDGHLAPQKCYNEVKMSCLKPFYCWPV